MSKLVRQVVTGFRATSHAAEEGQAHHQMIQDLHEWVARAPQGRGDGQQEDQPGQRPDRPEHGRGQRERRTPGPVRADRPAPCEQDHGQEGHAHRDTGTRDHERHRQVIAFFDSRAPPAATAHNRKTVALKTRALLFSGRGHPVRDRARRPGELEDVHAGVGAVDDVNIAAVVDFDIVGLDGAPAQRRRRRLRLADRTCRSAAVLSSARM